MMLAKYGGVCSECGNWFDSGDEIGRVRGGWGHARCSSADGAQVQPDGPYRVRVKHPVCDVCFLTHGEGQCDRQ